MTRERDIERYLHARIKALGGECRRMQWIGRGTAPDDFILLPGEHAVAELKRPGEAPTAAQAREHERLRAAGVTVHVFSTKAQIDDTYPPP